MNREPRTGDGGDPNALPLDERLRQNGARLVESLAATFRVGRSHGVQNLLFQEQLAGLRQAIQPALTEQGEAVLVAVDGHIYFNGVRTPVKANGFKDNQSVVDALSRLRITGLRLEAGVGAEDLTRFFELLLKQDGPTGTDLVSTCYALTVRGALPIASTTVLPGFPAESDAAPAEGVVADGGAAGRPERVARLRHAHALHGARFLLLPTSLQSDVAVRHAKRIVQPLIEAVLVGEPIVSCLSVRFGPEEHAYSHAVNVCALSVTMGQFLDLDRRALADLGVASLLHDVGKHAVAGGIRHDYEEWTPDERAAAERHPLEGVRLLARSTALSPTIYACMRVALEHHAGEPGGYPRLPAGPAPGLMSQLVAIADCYLGLQNRLSRKVPGVSPAEALAKVLGPLARRFEPALRWALVRSVGLYPPGQLVEMDDGSRAVALAPNAADAARPHVRILTAPNGAPVARGPATELRPIPVERSVRRAVRLAEYPPGFDDVAAMFDDPEDGARAA